ncbi:RraA family protein [Oribacterium sp. NK2B42]|uniref:RraA family protein n=1 Tax=Oribacterium sp. NK2B42 TaxID=689781 RepID=UPI00040DECAE|nr:RraA family protein [Oribacterium sp. NK2B42]
MINKNAPLLPEEIISRVRKLGVALLLDGVKKAKISIPMDGCMCAEMKPVGTTRLMIGTALTVETEEGDNLPINIAAYTSPLAGYVMVVDGKAYKERPYIGDLFERACKAMGLEGIVVNGYSRDSEGTKSLDFPVYSLGILPRGPIRKREGNINTEITCAGVNVKPGDLVVGDADGVCVIPKEYIEVVLEKTEEKQAYEVKRVALIVSYASALENGGELPELAPKEVIEVRKRLEQS